MILEGIDFGFGFGIRINEKGEQSIETLEYSSIRHLALDSVVLLKADYGQFLSSSRRFEVLSDLTSQTSFITSLK